MEDEEEPGSEEPESLPDVEIPIEDHLDLHPFRPREIPSLVGSYLEAAAERGFHEVRLIHGRGIGALRKTVRAVLSRHPDVIEYVDGTPERGGWGATVVRLRVRRKPK